MPALRWAEIAALPSFFGSSKKMECENCMKKTNMSWTQFLQQKILVSG